MLDAANKSAGQSMNDKEISKGRIDNYGGNINVDYQIAALDVILPSSILEKDWIGGRKRITKSIYDSQYGYK